MQFQSLNRQSVTFPTLFVLRHFVVRIAVVACKTMNERRLTRWCAQQYCESSSQLLVASFRKKHYDENTFLSYDETCKILFSSTVVVLDEFIKRCFKAMSYDEFGCQYIYQDIPHH